MPAIVSVFAPTLWAGGQERSEGLGVIRVEIRQNGRILAPLTVNGEEDCRFLFDTGANTTVLSERLAAKAGVNAANMKRVGTYAGPISLAAGRVEIVVFGGYRIAAVDIVIDDLGRMFNLDPEIEGIESLDIGDNRLRNLEAYIAVRGPGRLEDGFLPLHLFDSIYVNNRTTS